MTVNLIPEEVLVWSCHLACYCFTAIAAVIACLFAARA